MADVARAILIVATFPRRLPYYKNTSYLCGLHIALLWMSPSCIAILDKSFYESLEFVIYSWISTLNGVNESYDILLHAILFFMTLECATDWRVYLRNVEPLYSVICWINMLFHVVCVCCHNQGNMLSQYASEICWTFFWILHRETDIANECSVEKLYLH